MRSFPLLEVVVTARPSWARVQSLVSQYLELAGRDKIRLSLVGPAISSRYGDISDQIDSRIQLSTYSTLQDSDDLSSVALTSFEGGSALSRSWKNNRPQCVLVIADRTETLGVAVAASLMQIPLIHLQGGEKSGSIDDKVRDANSMLADLHLTTNSHTRDRLLNLGISEESISIIGCPSIDLAKEVAHLSQDSLNNLLPEQRGVGVNIDFSKPFGIVMFHPDTLYPTENTFWMHRIFEFVKQSPINWIWFWPNTDHGTTGISKQLRQARESLSLGNLRFIVNLPPRSFLAMAMKSEVLIGNSSFGIREASYLGLPVVNIGRRQNLRQRAQNVVDIQEMISESDFKAQLDIVMCHGKYARSYLYGEGDAGRRGAEAIANWDYGS